MGATKRSHNWGWGHRRNPLKHYICLPRCDTFPLKYCFSLHWGRHRSPPWEGASTVSYAIPCDEELLYITLCTYYPQTTGSDMVPLTPKMIQDSKKQIYKTQMLHVFCLFGLAVGSGGRIGWSGRSDGSGGQIGRLGKRPWSLGLPEKHTWIIFRPIWIIFLTNN